MFKKELELKKVVNENLTQAKSRDLLMTYAACWLHEPFISKDKDFLIYSMLKEVELT